MFQNRRDAARRLAARLQAFQGQNPLVLAIPRGAAPMGALIAQQLGGQWDVVLVRKLHAPFLPEVAVGAVDESGWAYIAPQAAWMGADAAYLDQEKHTQLQALRARRALYTPVRAPIDPAGRTVIVVDDGLATGATMVAALHSLRAQHPARLVCAVPVASREALAMVQALADEVVCLEAPPDFEAVGQFYRDFAQVEDDEVVRLLADI
ncbi:MAG: phosphoribosyltransferase family protein [Giesbergeria sp.]|jgi:predicted phosphoribosyltransferase|nr:phosphoribosyltransferase family protein [Giesbergeria sp.]